MLSASAVHPNAVAAALSMLCALAWALWLFVRREQSFGQRLLLALAGASTAGILLLSQSRGALLSLAISLPLLAVLRWRRAWWALGPPGLAALVIHGLVDAGSWVTWPVLIVWALWGLTMASLRLLGAERGPEP